jgi:hypothetical protein
MFGNNQDDYIIRIRFDANLIALWNELSLREFTQEKFHNESVAGVCDHVLVIIIAAILCQSFCLKHFVVGDGQQGN